MAGDRPATTFYINYYRPTVMVRDSNGRTWTTVQSTTHDVRIPVKITRY